MKKPLTVALLGLAVHLTACAQAPQGSAGAQAATAQPAAASAPAVVEPAPGTPDERALAALRKLSPDIKPERLGAAPIAGFRQAIVGGQVVYVSDDGRYLFLLGNGGALYDASQQKDLSEAAIGALRVDLLKSIPASERIVFAPPNPKHTVTVFTDVECGYCRKLHQEIAEYNRQGIAVEYLAFPRMGVGSEDFQKMVSVWCAPDRRRALTDAKNERSVPTRNCTNTVRMQYDIGQRVGLTGTPMILTARGEQVGGYVPPAALRERLDKLAGVAPAGAAAGSP